MSLPYAEEYGKQLSLQMVSAATGMPVEQITPLNWEENEFNF